MQKSDQVGEKLNNLFYLLDSRAGLLAVENNGILNTEDNGKYILFTGTYEECKKLANNEELGSLNVISDPKFNILWENFSSKGKWESIK